MEGFVPWPREFAERYRAAGYWQDRTISEVMDERFRRYGRRWALISDDGRRYTHGELARLTTRLALHLNALGLALYDRVVLQLHNVPELPITYLAVVKAGGIPIAALPAHREAEIAHFVEASGARACVVPASWKGFDFPEMITRVRQSHPSLATVLVAGGETRSGCVSLEELLKDPIEERVDEGVLPRPDPALPATLQLSGGTTGVPKMIPRTHNDYVYIALQSAEVTGLDETAVGLVGIPQQHNFALATPGLLGFLARGGCEVLSASPDAESLLSLIERHRVTHISAVPALVLSLLNHPRRGSYDLSSLRAAFVGGSKLNREVAVRMRPELGCEVQQVLGMAEGPLLFHRPDDPEEVRWETQGRPISPGDELRIVDPASGEPVPSGEVGELWFRGPATIRGYFRAPEHNAVAFSPEGFYKSGDLVRLHPSGNVVVEGRIKDCINRGGEKISAEEIENHILAHPAVANCAVVSMPDPILGERACAYVVLRPGGQMSLPTLSGFLTEERKIARYKLPERLEVVETLPLTAVGKVNKKALREKIQAELESGR